MKLRIVTLMAVFGGRNSGSRLEVSRPGEGHQDGRAGGTTDSGSGWRLFLGVEAVFEHLNGVLDVVSGYAGGSERTAHYTVVGTGTTGHAESVHITYDPATIIVRPAVEDLLRRCARSDTTEPPRT